MPECCQHLRQRLACEHVCVSVRVNEYSVERMRSLLLACALFVFVNESQMLCASKELAAAFLYEVVKERETETLPKVLKLGSFYSGIMAIPGDRLSLLSGFHYPPLFPALTKGQWV